MFSTIDKAWISTAVSFVAMTASRFFGIEIPLGIQEAVISLLVGLTVYRVPNKEA